MTPIDPKNAGKTTILRRFNNLVYLPRLLRMLWQASPILAIMSILIRLLRAVQPPLVLFVGKLIIDEIVNQTRMPSPGPSLGDWLENWRLSALAGWIALECILMIGNNLLLRAGTLAEGLLSERYGAAIGADLIAHAASLDLKDIESSQAQDHLLRAQIHAMNGNSLIVGVLSQVQNLVMLTTFLAGLFIYIPIVVTVLIISLFPTFLCEMHFNDKTYKWSVAVTPERRQMEYIRQVAAVAETAKEVKLFGLSDYLVKRFRALAASVFRTHRVIAVQRAIWSSLFGILVSLVYYGGFAVVAFNAVRGDISIGEMIFVTGSMLRLNGLFESIILGLTQIASQAQHLGDFFSFMDMRSSMPSLQDSRPFPAPLQRGVVFENVGFRYPGKTDWAFRHLNFTLSAGETLALVGENGAGKTTIVKLLTRLYDPDEGRILVDGIDLREIELDELRSHVGVIFQDFVRYNVTAAENIGISRVHRIDDRPNIVVAAQKSLADTLISRLPLAYDQMLGRRFADGLDLSGGEWQKIAIARAYFRDADILILDEPTAALDARAENEIFERFRNLKENKTALLISHRFSTVRMADRILVLENGEILESGSHKDLIALNGRYAELFELQAAAFL